MNVHSTVFHPIDDNGLYMIVASALPPGAQPHPTFPIKRSLAGSLPEAIDKCCELACEVRALTEQLGIPVRGIHCSHCPTRLAPKCGALAIG